MRKPFTHHALVLFSMGRITGEQSQLLNRIRQVMLIVVLCYPEEDRCNEVTMRCGELHYELTAEQLVNQRLKDDVGCKKLLCPIGGCCQTLHILSRSLPDRVMQ